MLICVPVLYGYGMFIVGMEHKVWSYIFPFNIDLVWSSCVPWSWSFSVILPLFLWNTGSKYYAKEFLGTRLPYAPFHFQRIRRPHKSFNGNFEFPLHLSNKYLRLGNLILKCPWEFKWPFIIPIDFWIQGIPLS